MILEERECNNGGQASLPPPSVIPFVNKMIVQILTWKERDEVFQCCLRKNRKNSITSKIESFNLQPFEDC